MPASSAPRMRYSSSTAMIHPTATVAHPTSDPLNANVFVAPGTAAGTIPVVLLTDAPLLPRTRYRVEVSGVTNIHGLPGGGGAVFFTTRAPPEPPPRRDTTELALPARAPGRR